MLYNQNNKMKAISVVPFLLLVLSIGIDNEGSMKVTSKILRELYDYCESDNYIDFPKKYGPNANTMCNILGQWICYCPC